MFFFSSRRRHTRYIGDWSSDVCSSDLDQVGALRSARHRPDQRSDYGISAPVKRRDTPAWEIGRASCRERVWMAVEGEAGEEEKRHEESVVYRHYMAQSSISLAAVLLWS